MQAPRRIEEPLQYIRARALFLNPKIAQAAAAAAAAAASGYGFEEDDDDDDDAHGSSSSSGEVCETCASLDVYKE